MEIKLIVPDDTKAITVSWVKEEFVSLSVGCHVAGTKEINDRVIECRESER